jgi:hypothetical protein
MDPSQVGLAVRLVSIMERGLGLESRADRDTHAGLLYVCPPL